MKALRAQYATLAPVTSRGKWQIMSRRVGTSDRYRVIAEATSEHIAEKIVEALNHVNAVVLLEAAE